MKMIFTFLLLLVAFLETSNQQCLSERDNRPINPNDIFELYTARQEFSFALLQAINQLMPNKSISFSPYTTFHSLLIAYFLATGQTESYLKKLLRLDTLQTKPDIYQAFKQDQGQRRLNKMNNSFELNNSNKMFVADQIRVRSCITTLFNGEFASVPLETDFINSWVQAHTRNTIRDLLPTGSINRDNTLVSVNAAYFKGKWKKQFDPRETKAESFYVSVSKQSIVHMMHMEGSFKHAVSESFEAHIVELPYEGEGISMYIILPPFTRADGIDNVLKKLTVDKFVEFDRLTVKTVHVSLPKFAIGHTIELIPVLRKMEFGDVFNGTWNLSGLSGDDNVSLEKVFHKARIEVNEQGPKPASASSKRNRRATSRAGPVQFNCNHPFVYVIYDKLEDTLLFAGVFRQIT